MKLIDLIVVFAGAVAGQGRLLSKAPTNLKRPSISLVNHTAFYAAAASCQNDAVKQWTCLSCTKAHKSKPSGVLVISSPRTRARGYVLVDKPNKLVVVSFRGANNINLGYLNLQYAQAPFADMKDPNVRVHRGFLEVLDSLTPQLMPHLKSAIKPGYNVLVTGFSLGGAVASLAAVRILNQLEVPFDKMTLITFGQPRTGNEQYAHSYNLLPIRAARVVNYNDPAPHTPPSNILGYTHHQNELFIEGGNGRYCARGVLEDPNCSNKLPGLYDARSHFEAFDAAFTPLLGC